MSELSNVELNQKEIITIITKNIGLMFHRRNYMKNKSWDYSEKECSHLCENLKYLEESNCNCSLNNFDDYLYKVCYNSTEQKNCYDKFIDNFNKVIKKTYLHVNIVRRNNTCDITIESSLIIFFCQLFSQSLLNLISKCFHNF